MINCHDSDSHGGAEPYAGVRSLTFASCYVYSPCGAGAASERSRLLCHFLKTRDAHFMGKYALRVRFEVDGPGPLAGYLEAADVLVPIPGSTPARAGTMSVAEHLSLALLEEGLGRTIWYGLKRACAVRKSATAKPGSRPTVRHHYDSFRIAGGRPNPPGRRIVLIDDVVTKGRTLLAAAARLSEACPNAEVRAFALLRTMGRGPGVERLTEPCVGGIRWRDGDAQRSP